MPSSPSREVGRDSRSFKYQNHRNRDKRLSISRSPPPSRRRRGRTHSKSPQNRSISRTSPRNQSRSPHRSRSRSRSIPQRERGRRNSFQGPEDRRRGFRKSNSPVRKPRSRSPHAKGDKNSSQKPNFGLSGKLAAETNTFNGVVLKYHEPPEARKPLEKWRLYVFKGEEQVDLLHIHRQSAYLLGRDRLIADIPIDHPSCSKQHAVLQYRQISEKDDYGKPHSSVKPYVIDLESSNGTYVNEIILFT
ncbi:hypothetical protein G9A89_008821 [Geosiphon pyriformis]|nr:hypothetical protein G9A89_008821 [Geosiphon pyriformis]